MAPAQLGPFFACRPIIRRCNCWPWMRRHCWRLGDVAALLARRVADCPRSAFARPGSARPLDQRPEPLVRPGAVGGAWHDSDVARSAGAGAGSSAGARTATDVRVVPVPRCLLPHRRALRRCAVRCLVHRRAAGRRRVCAHLRCGLPRDPARLSCFDPFEVHGVLLPGATEYRATITPAACQAYSSASNWNWTIRCELPSTSVSPPRPQRLVTSSTRVMPTTGSFESPPG